MNAFSKNCNGGSWRTSDTDAAGTGVTSTGPVGRFRRRLSPKDRTAIGTVAETATPKQGERQPSVAAVAVAVV